VSPRWHNGYVLRLVALLKSPLGSPCTFNYLQGEVSPHPHPPLSLGLVQNHSLVGELLSPPQPGSLLSRNRANKKSQKFQAVQGKPGRCKSTQSMDGHNAGPMGKPCPVLTTGRGGGRLPSGGQQAFCTDKINTSRQRAVWIQGMSLQEQAQCQQGRRGPTPTRKTEGESQGPPPAQARVTPWS
jgi:hypothetical protein